MCLPVYKNSMCFPTTNYHPFVSAWRTSFVISCKASLVVINSFIFCLSRKLHLYSILKDMFLVVIFPFSILTISSNSFHLISAEKSTASLIGGSLVYNKLLFSWCFQHAFLVFNFWQINVSLWASLGSSLELSGIPGSGCLFLSSGWGSLRPLFL